MPENEAKDQVQVTLMKYDTTGKQRWTTGLNGHIHFPHWCLLLRWFPWTLSRTLMQAGWKWVGGKKRHITHLQCNTFVHNIYKKNHITCIETLNEKWTHIPVLKWLHQNYQYILKNYIIMLHQTFVHNLETLQLQVQFWVSHLLPSVFGNLPLVIDVTLVAKHHFFNISWSMLNTQERTNVIKWEQLLLRFCHFQKRKRSFRVC